MQTRRAQRSQLAPKIGHEADAAAADMSYVPSGANASTPHRHGGNAKPTTPPMQRSRVPLFPEMDRGAAYYNSGDDQHGGAAAAAPHPPAAAAAPPLGHHHHHQPPPQLNVSGPDAADGDVRHGRRRQGNPDDVPPNESGALSALYGGAGDAQPKYGRRARTQETDDRDRSRQERLRQYQEELRVQMESEKARKREEAERRKREDYEMDMKARRETEARAQQEREDIERERRDEDSKAEQMMGGGKPRRKRDPNAAPTGGGGDDGGAVKFGRRAGNDGGDAAKQEAEARYRQELQEQAEAVRRRKDAEVAKEKAEQDAFDARMNAWASNDGPLGAKSDPQAAALPSGRGGAMPPPPRQQQQQQPPPADPYYGGGGDLFGGASAPPQPPGNEPWGQPAAPPPPPGYAQQQQQQFQQPPPQQDYMMPGGQPQMTGGGDPGTQAVAMLRDEIMGLLQQQQQMQHAPQSPQFYQQQPGYVGPGGIAQPPPAHRGYAAQNATSPYAGGVMVRRPLAGADDTQQMLTRFLQEDPGRRDGPGMYAAIAPPPQGAAYPPSGGPSPRLDGPRHPQAAPSVAGGVNASALSLGGDSEFVDRGQPAGAGRFSQEYLTSNVELDSEPPRFIYASSRSDAAAAAAAPEEGDVALDA